MNAAPQLALAAHVVSLHGPTDFAGWRDAARRLARAGVEPGEVEWEVALPLTCLPASSPRERGEESSVNVDGNSPTVAIPSARLPGEGKGEGQELRVPREFVERAEAVICNADPERFAFLYHMLWRLRDEPNLLKIASDPDVRRFDALEKAVRRDIHKMRAFVRFRRIVSDMGDRYVAWFEPSHYIVERNAPFFVRRFTGMHWTILTPYRSARWDGEALAFGPGGSRADAPPDDGAEELWLTYYENIFNPGRLKPQAMQKEMPKKYWRNLPEAVLIPDLIKGADQAAKEMIARMPTIPARHHAAIQAKHWQERKERPGETDAPAKTLGELKIQAAGCRRCPLWRDATQTVCGEGPDNAQVVFVGEQPGDQEDIAGRPFVGPAGKVFDTVLDEAEIDREKIYVTNAVKHFKFEPRGKRRIHAKPNAGEVQACRWWLDQELDLIKPKLVVAMGATAALSLLGKAIPVTKMRGQTITRDDGLRVFLTVHPSFILRIPDAAQKEAEIARFRADLVAVKQLMVSRSGSLGGR